MAHIIFNKKLFIFSVTLLAQGNSSRIESDQTRGASADFDLYQNMHEMFGAPWGHPGIAARGSDYPGKTPGERSALENFNAAKKYKFNHWEGQINLAFAAERATPSEALKMAKELNEAGIAKWAGEFAGKALEAKDLSCEEWILMNWIKFKAAISGCCCGIEWQY
jgi:hypothetical protein